LPGKRNVKTETPVQGRTMMAPENGGSESHHRGYLYLGVVLIALAGIVAAAFYFALPNLWSQAWVQVLLVLAVVSGSSFSTLALHSSGKIQKQTLERTTLTLAVAAIIFAAWQFRDARVQEERMADLSKELTTRFVGIFPKNMKDINEVVADTNGHLDIMCDFVGYAHYSASREFIKYLRQLEDLRIQKRLPIRLLVYTLEKGQKTHDTQFTDKSFQKAVADEDPKLLNFCQSYNKGRLPASKGEFDALLFQRQREYMKILKDVGVRIRITSQELPFFLWDDDDQEAVFSFLNEDLPDAREVSFRTRDRSLIQETFKVRFCRFWDTASDVEITEDGWKPIPANQKENCPPIQSWETCRLEGLSP